MNPRPLWLGLALAGCTTETVFEERVEQRTALEHGQALFSGPSASPSPLNAFSCATCHLTSPDPSDSRILPGAPLAGATERPTFWGGAENDLLRSINACRTYFMSAQQAWTVEDEEAKVLYLFLKSLPVDDTDAQPFSIVPVATDLPEGDVTLGADVYDRACRSCHGAAHTGEGRLTDRAPLLPEVSVAYFEGLGFDPIEVRTVFVEKVRHGAFLGLFGNMPPYSTEALSDDELGAMLTFLEL